jgi:hypothetical protein
MVLLSYKASLEGPIPRNAYNYILTHQVIVKKCTNRTHIPSLDYNNL